MLLQRSARGSFDFRQYVRVIPAGYDFAKGDARGETEDFPAAQNLARQLKHECDALAVAPFFAKPRDGIFHGSWRDDSADDCDENLKPGRMFKKNFKTARPMVEIRVGLRHEFRIWFDFAEREDEQGTAAFEMTDCFSHDAHSSVSVFFIGGVNGAFADVGKMFEEGNIADDGFVIGAVDVGGDDD